MTEFIETIENNPKAQKHIEVFVIKKSNQSSKAQYPIPNGPNGNNPKTTIHEQAIKKMGETIEDMDEKSEFKDNGKNFLADKIGISDKQIIQEMEQVNVNEFLDKADGVKK